MAYSLIPKFNFIFLFKQIVYIYWLNFIYLLILFNLFNIFSFDFYSLFIRQIVVYYINIV